MELQLVQNLKTDENGYIVFNGNLRIDLHDIEQSATLIVDDITEHRAHLLSMAAYNTTEFADMILLYNNINNPFYIPVGTVIRIPDLNDIQSKILAYNHINTTMQESSIVQRNTLTAKGNKGSNVVRSDGRLIFTKQK